MKRLGTLAMGVAAATLLFSPWRSPAREASTQPWDEISVVSPTVGYIGHDFSVDINIPQVYLYNAYWAWLEWDDTILEYVDPPGVTHTGLNSMVPWEEPTVLANGVRFGAARAGSCADRTGTAATVRLRCIGPGTSTLHLVSLYEDPQWGTFLYCPGVDAWPQLFDDVVTCLADGDDADVDLDGCGYHQEALGAPAPCPGSTCTDSYWCYSDAIWYDFYDVPAPAVADPAPNGARDKAVTMRDVLAVLFYVGANEWEGTPNSNGVAYETIKGSCDRYGDTVPDKDGLCYDRSVSPLPYAPWMAGPPDRAINMQDVLAVLAQVGLSCTAPS